MLATFMKFSLFLAVVFIFISNFCTTAETRLCFPFENRSIEFDVIVESYYPRGLKIVVPHNDGLEQMSIHGRIVSPSSDNEESFARDIHQSTNGQWIFQDDDQIINVGDTLFYWIFIHYKGVGQRFNDLVYEVKDLKNIPGYIEIGPRQDTDVNELDLFFFKNISTKVPQSGSKKHRNKHKIQPQTESEITYEDPQNCPCKDKQFKDMLNQIKFAANRINTLAEMASPINSMIARLSEALDVFNGNIGIDQYLLLVGDLPAKTNPVEDIRHILIEKLDLVRLSSSIQQAQYVLDGIAFQMKSTSDKLLILRRSKDMLYAEKYKMSEWENRNSPERGDIDATEFTINPRFDDS